MLKAFLIIWITVIMDGAPISSVRVQIPQDSMEICQQSLQNLTYTFGVDNREYWDGYDLMVTSQCLLRFVKNETR